MAVCRYGFHKGVMAYMLQFGDSVIHRIFVAWIVIFSCLNLKPDDGYLTFHMPEFFDKTGHSLTNIVIA